MKRIHGVALTALIGTGMAFGDKAPVRTVHERPMLVGVVERCPESDLVELQRAYTVAMERAGHIPVVIPRTEGREATRRILGKIDLVLLKKLAPGFRVSAVAPDGVVEAMEAVDYPAAAVQFHPEKMVGQDDFDQKRLMALLRRLPDLCR